LQNWYFVAKISSEEAALEYAKQTGLDVVTVNPAVVFDPLLQPTLNTSCQFLVYFLKGSLSRIAKQCAEFISSFYNSPYSRLCYCSDLIVLYCLFYVDAGGSDRMRDKLWHIVDVRDTADALLLVYETPQASGRHICAPHFISICDLLELLKTMYPDDYPFISK
jgi:nucleoside-diphosphate-sugar epimerase